METLKSIIAIGIKIPIAYGLLKVLISVFIRTQLYHDITFNILLINIIQNLRIEESQNIHDITLEVNEIMKPKNKYYSDFIQYKLHNLINKRFISCGKIYLGKNNIPDYFTKKMPFRYKLFLKINKIALLIKLLK